MVAWPLAAFGGVYPWGYWPLLGGCVLLSVFSPPRFARDTIALDAALGLALLIGLAQLVPLPSRIVTAIAPGTVALHGALRLGQQPASAPLSIDPRSTAEALAVLASTVLLFWSARRTFASGGVRVVSRGIAWLGLLMACAAIVQLAVSRTRIYGFWTPRDAGALPFGPFVSRNDAATWLILAIPLCFGYLLARLRPGSTRAFTAAAVRRAIDGRAVWLLGAVMAMLIALTVSLSRSAVIAILVAAPAAAVLVRSRLDSVRRTWAAAAVVVAAVAVLQLADVIAVANRFGESSQGVAGRVHIWRDTLRACGALWPTGSGLGTFERAMLLFQTGDRAYYFNHAHNQFLQVIAEGGVLLALSSIVGLIALARVTRARLAAEPSGLFWIRAGAATGLLAAAVQSLWDTGLSVPANAALAAVLAAIATHRPRAAEPPASRSGTWH